LKNDQGKQTRQKRQIATYATLWPNKKLFYYFDATITAENQAYVRKQLKYLSDRTCITFTESSTVTNRVKVFDGTGCFGAMGMTGGEQTLSLANRCFVVSRDCGSRIHARSRCSAHACAT
uniref:Astacin domain-containing protein n=1 Tax=Haemonchus placei TaxID=6290 RepID=A0A0N4X6B9_HAEPC